MNEKDTVRSVLAVLNTALLGSHHDLVERVLAACELTTLLSQNTVSIARAESKPHLVQFLCTLAVHNNVEAERAQHWLDIYQAIAGKDLSLSLQQLSRNNVLRLTIEAIRSRNSLEINTLKKVKGSSMMWLDAIDLSIDNHDWESAYALVEHFGKAPQETKIWLQISRNLSVRHPIYVDQTGFQKVDIDYNRLAQLYDLCANAMRNAGINEGVKALKPLQANALEIAGQSDAAIKILKTLQGKSNCKTIDVDIARIKCKQGDLLGSIEHLDKVLLALKGPSEESKEIADQLIEGEKKQASANSQTKFNIDAAQRALGDLLNVAKSNALDVFLVSGTLLGCVREGAFLGHDKDIDVGILGWEQQYALYTALIKSGLFTFNAQFLKGHETIYLPMLHKSTGVWIDIFVYHPKDGKWFTGVDFFFGYRQTFSFTPFELEKRDFLGLEVLIPKNYALNLEENFGSWKEPDTGYISHLESPSTDNKGALPFMLTARLTAYRSIVKEDVKKIRKILAIMEQHHNKEGVMPPLLMNHLKNIASEFDSDTKTEMLKELDHV